jgi:ABC-type siderophore export system fused ATPase/permease subunit
MTEEILVIIGIILLGSIAYIHYTMNKLQDEIKAVWLQIAVIAAATARQFKKLEEEKNKNNDE